MSYVVLARRYRPQIFADLVGQEHVTRTLKNALKTNRTSHAYLFTGPRGVGKTSAARILAKALRCLEPTDDREPCNLCPACVAVNEGSSMDVLEIDAASNTGVDNIRDLRDNVGYMASVGKYRVYIIDEVHMLSTAAFNALLKTLEEPPPHVVFIFATTELHKVLPTIQSRCQRFDFKKIAPDVLGRKLREICEKEKVKIDEASLRTLVFESEGCLRDAESLLDQAIALCGSEIKIEVLESTLGLVDRASFFALMKSLATHDPGQALGLCTAIMDRGIDAKVLLARVADFIRDLHYHAFTRKFTGDDEGWNEALGFLAQKLSSDEVVRGMDLVIKAQASLSSALSGQFTVESLIVKLSLQRPALSAQLELATSSHDPDEHDLSGPPPDLSPPPSFTESQIGAPSKTYAQPVAPYRSASPAISSTAPATGAHKARADFQNYISEHKPAWMPVMQSLMSLEIKEGVVFAKAKNDFAGRRLASADGITLLKKSLEVAQARVELEGTAATSASANPGKNHQQVLQEKRQLAKDHEAVKAAVRIFNAVVTETKILE